MSLILRDVEIDGRPGLDVRLDGGRIAAIGPGEGPMVELKLDVGGTTLTARITRRALHALDLAVGQDVFAMIKSIAFDRHSVGLHSETP